MAWFVYNFPGNPLSPCSYQFIAVAPSSTGVTLCAINTDNVPTKPDLDKPGVKEAIDRTLMGEITPGVTRLRPAD